MKIHSIQGIPLSYIKSILKIDPSSPSGLTWLPRDDDDSWNTKHANKLAGYFHVDNRGYKSYKLTIRYNNKKHDIRCSRIIMILNNGFLTNGKVADHINNNAIDNSLKNIREATISENCRNSKLRKNNTSGIKGISWDKKRKKWEVKLYVNYKKIHIGYFLSLEDAKEAISQARKKFHGEFGRDQ